jgi:plastocyanin
VAPPSASFCDEHQDFLPLKWGDVMKKTCSRIPALSVLVLFALLLAACSKKEGAEHSANSTPQASSSPAATATPATETTVNGKVKFEGTAPMPSKIDTSQDPACPQGVNQTEDVVVNNGGLANVFVYVKEGLGSRTFPLYTGNDQDVEIYQSGCKYRPHVIGLMVGQQVGFTNNDQIAHSIHAIAKLNAEWKESQSPRDPGSSSPPQFFKTFSHEEIMLPVQCDRHPWMKMYINVVKSPFYDVTDTNGSYELSGLPPGDYTIAFVHEKLGELDQKVTLAPNETKPLDEIFKSGNE